MADWNNLYCQMCNNSYINQVQQFIQSIRYKLNQSIEEILNLIANISNNKTNRVLSNS